METVEIITGYWVILFLFYLFIVGRLFFIITPILSIYYFEEKIEWNEKINPEKLKIYLILFLLASFLIWFSYQPLIKPKSLFDIWCTFIVGTVGLAGIYLVIENKIRTPSKKYLNNSSSKINDIQLGSNVINKQNNILLADIKKIITHFYE
jgi:CDP-diglyceride synthetase